MSDDPISIIARTFQRGEDHDEDWYAGRASAAVFNLTSQGWRLVRNESSNPTPHISIAVNRECMADGVGPAKKR